MIDLQDYEGSKLPLITSVFLNVTNACNLACRYCFVKQSPDYMTYQTAKDSADFLIHNAEIAGVTPAITFFGGEPLLGWDSVIRPLVDYIRKEYQKPFDLSITSNCTLMDEEKLSYMKRNKVGLLFSVDGDRTTQDHNRPTQTGASSFDLLQDKFELILRYYPTVTFRSTVTPATVNNLFNNILFAEDLGFKNYFVMPNCYEYWSRNDCDILLRELHKYSEHYVDALKHGLEPIYFNHMEGRFKDILIYNDAVIKGERRQIGGCHACGKCGLGASKFAGINWDGRITTCQEFFSNDDVFGVGDIYSGVDDSKRKRLMNIFDEQPVYSVSFDKCKSCSIDRICSGGCVANNLMINGDMHAVPEVYCEWAQALFNEAVFVMTQLGKEESKEFAVRWKKGLRGSAN